MNGIYLALNPVMSNKLMKMETKSVSTHRTGNALKILKKSNPGNALIVAGLNNLFSLLVEAVKNTHMVNSAGKSQFVLLNGPKLNTLVIALMSTSGHALLAGPTTIKPSPIECANPHPLSALREPFNQLTIKDRSFAE